MLCTGLGHGLGCGIGPGPRLLADVRCRRRIRRHLVRPSGEQRKRGRSGQRGRGVLLRLAPGALRGGLPARLGG
eukprot:1171872-Alexandrium_andersonii.AAC.1